MTTETITNTSNIDLISPNSSPSKSQYVIIVFTPDLIDECLEDCVDNSAYN